MADLLSMKQVTQQLGISERTVYRLISEDKLHPFKMGKAWKFEQSDINTYIEELRAESQIRRGRKRGSTDQSKDSMPTA